MENNLPESWELVKLVEQLYYLPTGVVEFVGTKKYFSTGSIQENEFTSEGEFTFANRPSRANRIAVIGDVLQARMKATDKGILIDDKLEGQLFSTGFLQVRPYGNTFNNKLLYYFIKSDFFLTQKNELATGSTQEALTDNGASEIEIPIPPLAEQHRIVAKLDAVMQKVESNKQRLDKIPKLLKRFRQSVLAASVSGKLTEDWREKNKEVNIYKTENKYEEYEWRNLDFPSTWKWDYIKNISHHILGKMLDAAKNKGEPTLYLRNVSVRWFDFDLDTLTEIKATKEDKLKFDLQDGDLFVCEGGEPGRAAVWNKGKNNFIFQKAIHRIRLNEFVNPYWVLYNLKLDADSGNLESLFTGTGIKHLTLKSLSKYPIAIPPIEEQIEIVRRVEQLFAFADKIEARYTKAKTMLDKLPQSILAKAFRGELVAQDSNDEPASVLLERIKLEKEKLAAEKKGKKTKEYSIEETPVKIAAEKGVKYKKKKND